MASSLSNSKGLKRISLSAFSLGIIASCFGQDTTYGNYSPAPERLWYLKQEVWIAGSVILLLILIAVFRGRTKITDKNERLMDGKFRVRKIKKRNSNS